MYAAATLINPRLSMGAGILRLPKKGERNRRNTLAREPDCNPVSGARWRILFIRQRQASAHISSMVLAALQDNKRSALSVRAQYSGTSPALLLLTHHLIFDEAESAREGRALA
jgi:hypothetical protein